MAPPRRNGVAETEEGCWQKSKCDTCKYVCDGDAYWVYNLFCRCVCMCVCVYQQPCNPLCHKREREREREGEREGLTSCPLSVLSSLSFPSRAFKRE